MWHSVLFILTLSSLILWGVITLLPWRPWLTKESWDVSENNREAADSLRDITVLIPARNESAVIRTTLTAISQQGKNIKVVLVDDHSEDNTAQIARSVDNIDLKIVKNKPLPPGWSGKLWALENGRNHVETPFTLLLDADIKTEPGVIYGLKEKLKRTNKSFVSLMAMPSLSAFWERMLMPAFIYFFKLLYPFKPANSDSKWIAAAAGGCILVKTEVLDSVGGFAALKETLIDDCTLARKVKEAGYSTWLGLTHSVKSIRPYGGLREIWNMVARTAYTQLQYSVLLLLLCSLLMILAYIVPLIGLFYYQKPVFWISAFTLFLMSATYLPTLKYYRLSTLRVLSMPFVGTLFLGMTWTSAFRYWCGERMRWRGRVVTE